MKKKISIILALIFVITIAGETFKEKVIKPGRQIKNESYESDSDEKSDELIDSNDNLGQANNARQKQNRRDNSESVTNRKVNNESQSSSVVSNPSKDTLSEIETIEENSIGTEGR